MANKRGIYLSVILLIILSSFNIFLFINNSSLSFNSISGNLIKDFPKLPIGMNISTIAFIINWIVIIIIIIITISKLMKGTKNDEIQISFDRIKNKKSRSETDLDILYNLLIEKKSLSVGAISKTFKINKDKALEWGKILENYDLARIEYPTFSEPEIRIYDKNEIKEKQEEEIIDIKKKDGEEPHKYHNEKENKTSKEIKKTHKKERRKQKRK